MGANQNKGSAALARNFTSNGRRRGDQASSPTSVPQRCAHGDPPSAGSKIHPWNKELTITNVNDMTPLTRILQDIPEWRKTSGA